MPTARELLEQADALMRRNRLGTALPAAAGTEEGIPTLLDIVNAPMEAAARAAGTARAAPAAPAPPADLEDVPVLTDAVEEIEASSVLDEPDTADATMWSDTFTGMHSILGGDELAPPPAGAMPAGPPTVAKPPLHLVTPAASAQLPAEAIESIDIPPPPEPVETIAYGSSEPFPPPPAAQESAEPETAAPAPLEEPAEAPIDIAEPLLETIEAPHADDTVDLVEQPHVEPEATVPFAATGEGAAPPEPAYVPSVPSAPASPEHDDARWNALAEEIRMQVLQRIDLFTDTGLREQLAVRLQPIVDRASADLVATINQHVGILLRAYVSEAIEREIERWRSQSH
jgi:hypothetical protein